jgi:surface protein
MNQDIIEEILQQLYYVDLYFTDKGEIRDNQLKTAKKLLVSLKKCKPLESIKFDKPVVFSLSLEVNAENYINSATTVYQKGGFIYIRTYDEMHLVRIYNFVRIIMSRELIDIYSIGDMTDASGLIADSTKLKRNVGRNLDTSSVTNMSYMFMYCKSLNKNIGKNWDTSSVISMAGMFLCCRRLSKNIGKKWDVSRVKNMDGMFCGCKNLSKKVGKKWKISPETNTKDMFRGCKNFEQN